MPVNVGFIDKTCLCLCYVRCYFYKCIHKCYIFWSCTLHGLIILYITYLIQLLCLLLELFFISNVLIYNAIVIVAIVIVVVTARDELKTSKEVHFPQSLHLKGEALHISSILTESNSSD